MSTFSLLFSLIYFRILIMFRYLFFIINFFLEILTLLTKRDFIKEEIQELIELIKINYQTSLNELVDVKKMAGRK
ncbi:MAG: hypothetical protein BAJALOKI3v1_30030 [Promethearchaeota archaeon]|nr:MAG: hypothetical protein BAJALOKI3v1_30030 [Candidatus Lokiarchaeota archaeon]